MFRIIKDKNSFEKIINERIKFSFSKSSLVNKILTKGARAIGVQLESGEKISADYVVSNADLQNT